MRSGFVEEHRPVLDLACRLVAGNAADVQMSALQWEVRSCFVVEQRRFPLVGVVAPGATRIPALPGELAGVRIFVAALAAHGRGLENDILHRQFQVGRLVAVQAGDSTMSTREQERCAGMIEPDDVRPDLGRVASFATHLAAAGPPLFHPFGKLAVVRISVARPARDVLEVIGHR